MALLRLFGGGLFCFSLNEKLTPKHLPERRRNDGVWETVMKIDKQVWLTLVVFGAVGCKGALPHPTEAMADPLPSLRVAVGQAAILSKSGLQSLAMARSFSQRSLLCGLR